MPIRGLLSSGSPSLSWGVAAGSETPQIRTPVLLLEVPTRKGQRRERKSLLNRNLSGHLTGELVTVNQGSEDDLRPLSRALPRVNGIVQGQLAVPPPPQHVLQSSHLAGKRVQGVTEQEK